MATIIKNEERDCCRKRQQTRLNHTDKYEFSATLQGFPAASASCVSGRPEGGKP